MSVSSLKYECNLHSGGITELNAHSCHLELNANECRHIIRFIYPVPIDPIWRNELDLLCIVNKENMCVETIERYYNKSPLLCPISYLHSDTNVHVIVNCIKKIITFLSELDNQKLSIGGSTKLSLLHKTLCNVILNVCSDGVVVSTHKYLLTKKKNSAKKGCLSILPKTVFYFLCRETKVTQVECGPHCRLKKQHSYFTNMNDALIHRCFCGPTELNKSNEFQTENIMSIFGDIE
jgi:hypothetical protein